MKETTQDFAWSLEIKYVKPNYTLHGKKEE